MEDGAPDGAGAPPSDSPRVRLEVAILAAEPPAPAPVVSAAGAGADSMRTVLVAAADADLRGYVRECLRERTDLRAMEAATPADAANFIEHDTLHLLIVDSRLAALTELLPAVPALLISDGTDGTGAARSWPTRIASPFSERSLLEAVARLLGEDPPRRAQGRPQR
jgi:DNA-binding NtrC family response regulator